MTKPIERRVMDRLLAKLQAIRTELGYLKKREDIHVRELILDVPEEAVRALFGPPTVKVTVVKETSE